MSYRLFCIKISGTFTNHVTAFLEPYADLSFDETVELCCKNGYMYPGNFRHTLEAQGVEVMETLIDTAVLQNKWRRENGLPIEDVFDRNATLFAQIDKFKPDIVYLQTFFALAPEVRKAIKDRCPSVQLVVGHRGFPLEDDERGFEDVDAAFLGYTKHHDVWRAMGVKTINTLHAFDDTLLPAVLDKAKEIGPIEFSFIGHTGWGSPPHDGRYFDLRKMMDSLPLTVYGHEPKYSGQLIDSLPPGMRMRVRKYFIEIFKYCPRLGLRVLHKLGRVIGAPAVVRGVEAVMRRQQFGPEPTPPKVKDVWWNHVPPIGLAYAGRMHPSKFGIDYFGLLAASKLTWNRHQDTPGAGANMRLFEACGVGTCQLVDEREEVTACYTPDVEIVTYKTIDECLKKARWLLENPAEREKIAKAGQARTIREHTTRHRALEIHRHLLELLAEKEEQQIQIKRNLRA